MKTKLAQFFRFARVSLLATAIDFGIGYVLTRTGLTDIVAATILGSMVGIIVGFLLNKFWVFRDKTPNETGTQFVRYVLVSLGNTALNTLGVWSLAGLGMHNYWFMRVIVGTVVFVFYSYILTRAFVFTHPDSPPAVLH